MPDDARHLSSVHRRPAISPVDDALEVLPDLLRAVADLMDDWDLRAENIALIPELPRVLVKRDQLPRWCEALGVDYGSVVWEHIDGQMWVALWPSGYFDDQIISLSCVEPTPPQ